MRHYVTSFRVKLRAKGILSSHPADEGDGVQGNTIEERAANIRKTLASWHSKETRDTDANKEGRSANLPLMRSIVFRKEYEAAWRRIKKIKVSPVYQQLGKEAAWHEYRHC